jgi:hypothetical protein
MFRKAGALMVGALLLLGACGGGEDRLTKAEFTSKANAICKKASTELDKAGNEAFGSKEPTTDQIATYISDTLVPKVEQQLDDIDELKPPKDMEDDVDALLKTARADVAAVKKDVKADAEKLIQGDDPFADANQKADALGLKECGSGQ